MAQRWHNWVDAADEAYLDDLFADLPERAKDPGDDVFRQFCELSVGPLWTVKNGECVPEDFQSPSFLQDFVQLPR